jgi:hypothetical protein
MEDAMKTFAMFAAGLLIASLPAMGQDLKQGERTMLRRCIRNVTVLSNLQLHIRLFCE